MEKLCAVVLAAGDGKRMKSAHPKVLSEVLFKPMIAWVTDACLAAGIETGCAVVGAGAEAVTALLPEGYAAVTQQQRQGTGHAASMAKEFIRAGGYTHVAVLYGDTPFITGEDIRRGYEQHIREGNQVTVTSAVVDSPTGYGRIIRQGERVAAIVEEKDASPQQREIREVNIGPYWCEAGFLLKFFEEMTNDNVQGEYYLTDCVAIALAGGGKVGAYIAPAPAAVGANSRGDLQKANELARRLVMDRHLENGVDIPFADGVVIGADVVIGQDTTILPGTILRGNTVVGTGCEIGPNSYLVDARVGDGCRIITSQVDSSTVGDNARIGPMSNVRPGCVIHNGVKVGDFVELKNSVVGEKTSVAHLTYVGDSDVGERCNFGCGVVTVNYDGGKKYRTVIGDDAFIGCNTNLVAPVSVGDRVYAAAGTTITEDVPDDALVIGRARQVIKENWVHERGRYTKHQK